MRQTATSPDQKPSLRGSIFSFLAFGAALLIVVLTLLAPPPTQDANSPRIEVSTNEGGR